MEFTHQHYQPGETIAAIATPPGEGGVAIIRISGKEALSVAAKVFSGPVFSYKTHTVHYGCVLDADGSRIDDALLIPMLGKRSYTGEDTIEIHCHGGGLVSRRVLEAVLRAGARTAMAGEFTFKAFINGKLDLAQAEAVQQLISAKNERALAAAENQLYGSLSEKISLFQKELIHTAAILEAWVDFPEEGLEFATMEEICSSILSVCEEMEKLERSFHNGKILHDGLSVCLVGSPNVGKSSLLNALLDKDRAIVSPIPGTTRDLLEDHMRLNGLSLKLIDTAGIREADEMIEQEGIRRSKKVMAQADLILLLLDAAKGIHAEDAQLLKEAPPSKTIIVWNKSDLPYPDLPLIDFPHVILLSATKKIGLELLYRKIDEVVWQDGPPSKEEIVISNVRHKESLGKAAAAARNVIQGLQDNVSPEFLTIDMRLALSELGKIIGTDITEGILSAIFSKFCIGK